MKTISRRRIHGLVVILALVLTGESRSIRGQTPPALPTDLQPVAAPDIPASVCNYYSIQRFSWWPPMPCNWLSDDTNIVLYVSASQGSNAVFVGDVDIDYVQRAAEAEVLRLARQAAHEAPPLPDGGGNWPQHFYGTNDFWLEAVSVASNLFHVVLHGTTNGSTYLITSTESLSAPTNCTWLIEGALQGGPGDATPFALGITLRTNSLFVEGVTKVFIKCCGVMGCIKKSVEPLPCGRSGLFKVGFAA